jgi:hypothetical protein
MHLNVISLAAALRILPRILPICPVFSALLRVDKLNTQEVKKENHSCVVFRTQVIPDTLCQTPRAPLDIFSVFSSLCPITTSWGMWGLGHAIVMLDEVSYCWPSLTRLWVLLVLERFRIST